MAQTAGFPDPHQEMAGADLRFAEQQGAEHPAALHRLLHMGGEFDAAGRSPRQAVQGAGHVFRQHGRIEFKVPDDAMQIRILQLQDLVQPMLQLHIRVAAQFTEGSRAVNGPISQIV